LDLANKPILINIHINKSTGQVWFDLSGDILGKTFQHDSFKSGFNYVLLGLNTTGQKCTLLTKDQSELAETASRSLLDKIDQLTI
jgi:cation transport ATPase